MDDETKTTPTVYINCVDTVQYSFASHLSTELRRKGISTIFVNSKGALDVIERASASVVVFSKDCLSSASYLDRLVTVVQCQREKKMLVVPVFYGISPSDVVFLEQVSSCSEEQIRALQDMRELLFRQSREECDDSELVDEIVKTVHEKLFPTEKIGINSRLLELENLICKQPWGIRRIGIWGMPGIGKTTLAKAVFDQISGSYEASCFIKHFDEAFHEKGLHRLLEEHFGKVLKELRRLPKDKKRTLVVLDDVQSPSVAESFLRGVSWFSPGSLIIITSRDKQVYRHCHINHVYEVRSLNEKESLQLISQCAFGEGIRDQELLDVIHYASGNPFALSCYGKELKELEMKTTFLELKRRTLDKIHDLFKRSYEELNDSEKNIFLDIACFFRGEDVDYVMQLLEGCGFLPHVGIDVLVEKCLVTISDQKVNMHNLIQDFGRQIINERLNRLWEPRSIKPLLEDDEFKEERALDIEGISLDISNLLFDVKPTAFNNMLSLRFLKIYCSSFENNDDGLRLPKGLESLPSELRLLHWEKYPLQSLPQDFDPGHLVELNLSYSQLQKLWGGTKNLKMLKMVKLCHSQQLTEIDDICKAQNIEEIDVQGCTKLQRFPATGHLQHLRVVNLSDCKEITNLPEVSSNIEELHLQGTSIRDLPVSIVSLFKQAKFNRELSDLLTNYPGVSRDLEESLVRLMSPNPHMGKLVFLNMKYCAHLKSLPQMVDIESLQVLDLSGCSELEVIRGLPRNLKELYVNGTAIEELPQLPLSIEILNAHGCVSLISIPYHFERLPRYYTFSNCFHLNAHKVSKFVKKALANVEGIARKYHQELSKSLAFSFTVPSPTSTHFTSDLQPGSSVMIQLNSSSRSTLGFAIFVQVSFSEDYHEASGFGISCVCRWKDNKCVSHWMEKSFHCWTPEEGVKMEHTFVFCDFNMHPRTCEGNDDPSILAGLLVFEFFTLNKQQKILDESCTVKKCGVHVFTADDAGEDASSNITRPITTSSSNHMQKLFYQEVEQPLRVMYDDLDETNSNVFHYITSLFNEEEEDDDFLAALIASIGVRISYAPASTYLLNMSPHGISMLHGLLQRISREIAHKQSLDDMLFSSSSLSCIWKYDIFTSFSEEDDCSNKISHLLTKLECKRKRSKSVVKEIRESKGLIVVLSKNYASSTRCLDQLVEIMKSKEELAQTVVPIFYKVAPSDVREQIGDFGRVFENTCMGKSENEKQKWVQALTDVANIARVDARKRDNEANMKKNVRHSQTQRQREAWAWGLGKVYQFAGSVFKKESLPALLVTTVYKPCHSARPILIRARSRSFKIIRSTTGQIIGVEYSSGDGEEIVSGTSPFRGLPRDIIVKIISFTSPRDAWNVTLVSKFFESAAKDDRVWEEFLPQEYSSLIPQSINFSSKEEVYSYLCEHFLIEDGKKSFWLEKGSGKRCFMLSARELSITWADTEERRQRAVNKGSISIDTRMYWDWISIPEARFNKVVELLYVYWFEVRAKTDSRLLSPGTRYSAYIVFMTNDECDGFLNMPVEVELNLVGKEFSKRSIYFVVEPTGRRRAPKPPKWRKDGWMEAELGEFFNEESCDEIELYIHEIESLHRKSGLIIQGVEFRPQR